jgi:O-antigen ligase/polysaccharide polymerase Wzy-like membrane protein
MPRLREDPESAAGVERPRAARLARSERAALTALAIAPAVVIPGGLNRFVFGKLAVAAFGVLCAAIAPARGRLPRAAWWWLAAAGLLLVLAALSSRNPHAELIGMPPRYEGIVALPVYLGCLAAGARLLGRDRASGSTAWFLRWLSVAALAGGVVAILEAAGVEPLPGTGARAGSLLGNASDEGALALVLLGPLTAIALMGRRALHVAGAGAAAAMLVCAGSRGALVGLLALAVVLGLLTPGRRPAALVAIAAAIVLLAALVMPGVGARVVGRSPLAGRTATGRWLLLQEGVRLTAAAPLLGLGPSGFADSVPGVHSAEYERVIGPENPPDSPHDWVLQAAVAGGAGLSAIALVLVWLTARTGWRGLALHPGAGEAAAYAGMLAGLGGYAVALLFHFTSPGTTPVAAVLAGALLGSGLGARSAGSVLARVGRVGGIAALGALVVLLTCAAIAELPLRNAVLDAAAGRVGAANRQFDDAQAWRRWDPQIPQLATHVFAKLAADGVGGALVFGAAWSARALADDPHSVPTLEDAASIAQARGERARALVLVRRARRLEPRNPVLLARQRELLR